MHNCSMCPFSTSSFKRYVCHILRIHKDSPNFIITCNFSSCAYSTKSWNAFKAHNRRCHKDVDIISDEQVAATDDSVIGENDDITIDESSSLSENLRLLKNAEYALKLETQHRIPKSAVNDIIEHTSQLVSHYVSLAVKDIVASSGISLGNEDLERIKQVNFKNIRTEHN